MGILVFYHTWVWAFPRVPLFIYGGIVGGVFLCPKWAKSGLFWGVRGGSWGGVPKNPQKPRFLALFWPKNPPFITPRGGCYSAHPRQYPKNGEKMAPWSPFFALSANIPPRSLFLI
jgi:hypothetical protein